MNFKSLSGEEGEGRRRPEFTVSRGEVAFAKIGHLVAGNKIDATSLPDTRSEFETTSESKAQQVLAGNVALLNCIRGSETQRTSDQTSPLELVNTYVQSGLEAFSQAAEAMQGHDESSRVDQSLRR